MLSHVVLVLLCCDVVVVAGVVVVVVVYVSIVFAVDDGCGWCCRWWCLRVCC